MTFMFAKYFVDTNVLFYAYDRQAGTKYERARQLIAELWDSEQGALSTQVLQEFCVNLRRKTDLTALDIRALIRNFLNWHVVVNSGESILGALELETEHKISFWDALIVYAAQQAGAGILYSEDLSDGQSYGSVRVINPFNSGPSSERPRANS